VWRGGVGVWEVDRYLGQSCGVGCGVWRGGVGEEVGEGGAVGGVG